MRLLIMIWVIILPVISFAKDPIIMVTSNWPTQIIISKIFGNILKSLNYELKYQEYTTDAQWGALSRGAGSHTS